jgi:hypothetical protein
MLEGICPQCGRRHYGQALNRQRNQLCVKCGCGLAIRRNGVLIHQASLLGAIEYKIGLEKDHFEQMRQKVTFFLNRN